ncbi:MAG: transcriptional repressor [Clostridiales bacterium]|nr:transcriptional repressor [Candidatus Equinaster intestinalis]
MADNKDKHLTADDLVDILRKNGQNVSRTTVYRTLEKLVSEDKVRKYLFERNESACYQFLENGKTCHEHFHLKCTVCGRLTHLDCEHIKNLCSHILDDHGFTVDLSKTVLYGVCRECKEKTV